MGLKPEEPIYPDPAKTARTQYKYAKQAAADTALGANKAGPFGSTTTQYGADGLPTGQTASLAPGLQGGADSLAGNFTAQAGLLPNQAFSANVDPTGVRDSITDYYRSVQQPGWDREDKTNEVRMAERGIPIGSEVWNDQRQETQLNRGRLMQEAGDKAFIAGTQEEQRQRGNQLQDYQLPYQTTGQSLGLLSGAAGLAPGYSSLPGLSAPDYSGQVANKYNADYQNYQNQLQGMGSLASAGLGLLTAPLTGPVGLGSSILGSGMSSLFGAASQPSYASNSMFNLNNIGKTY